MTSTTDLEKMISSSGNSDFLPEKKATCFDRLFNNRILIVGIVTMTLFVDTMTTSSLKLILKTTICNDEEDYKNKSISANNTNQLENCATAPYTTTQAALVISTKYAAEILTNIFVGMLISRLGHTLTLIIGCGITAAATLSIGLYKNIYLLFSMRFFQGVGGSFAVVGGLTTIAQTYWTSEDDKIRGQSLGVVLFGQILAVLFGPYYGRDLSLTTGLLTISCIIAGIQLFNMAIQGVVLRPRKQSYILDDTPTLKLLIDPYVIICLGGLMMSQSGLAIILQGVPSWMENSMKTSTWEANSALLPCTLAYLVSTIAFGSLANDMGRWLATMFGNLLAGICLLTIPLGHSFVHTIVPLFFLGIANGMIYSSLMPTMAHLMDIRFEPGYGKIYALTDIVTCLPYMFAPIVVSQTNISVTFQWMVSIIGAISILSLPVFFYLRKLKTESNYLDESHDFTRSDFEVVGGSSGYFMNEKTMLSNKDALAEAISTYEIPKPVQEEKTRKKTKKFSLTNDSTSIPSSQILH